MSAKLHKIDELSKLLDNKNELASNLMELYRHFNLSQAMASCKITKFTGVSCSLLMLFLILSRLMSISKYQLYRRHYFDLVEEEVGKNCIYRFVNNPRFNWRSLLYAVAKSFFKNLNKSLEKSGVASEGKKDPTFFVKYGHKGKWNILLSTDTALKFTKVFEYYQVRWTTEVMYRECKQHLGLGKCQSKDFDEQIADCTLVFITYTMMTLRKRLNDYESYGVLFRKMGEEIGAMTLWQRILPLVKKLLMTLCEVLGVDYLETMESIAESPEQESRICAVIRALEMQDAA